MRIRKSGYIESNRTHCCTGKFNMALSLYRVLEVTLYFSKSFSEATSRELAVTKVLQSLEVTMICFLGQNSNLWSPTPQQRHRLFSRCFLHLSLVNLLLLASLEERSIHKELNCFLRAENKDGLEKDVLVDEAIGNGFALFWEAVAGPEVKAFPYFQK